MADDIDHLGNRRVRGCGGIGAEQIACRYFPDGEEHQGPYEYLRPGDRRSGTAHQSVVQSRPPIKEFFSSSQLVPVYGPGESVGGIGAQASSLGHGAGWIRLVNALDLKSATCIIRTMAVFARWKLRKVRTSVWWDTWRPMPASMNRDFLETPYLKIAHEAENTVEKMTGNRILNEDWPEWENW